MSVSLVAMGAGEKAIIERISPLLHCKISKIRRLYKIGVEQAAKVVKKVLLVRVVKKATETQTLVVSLKCSINTKEISKKSMT